MQNISAELENEIQDSAQTVVAKVRAQWADNRVLENLRVASSSDAWFNASKDTQDPALNVYWRMNDVAGSTFIQDYSGSGRNGTINGAPTLEQSSTPLTGDSTSKSILSSSGSRYIESTIAASCAFNGTNGTMEIWVRPTSATTMGIATNYSSGSGEVFIGTNGSGQVNFSVTGTLVQSTTVITDSNWHYLALVKAGSVWTLYCDAVSVIAQTKVIANNLFTTSWAGKNSSNNFVGNLTEFVGSQVAKTQYEISCRYKQISSSINNTFFIGRELFNARPEQTFPWATCNGVDENNQAIKANGKFYAMEDEPSGMYEYGYRSFRTTNTAYQTMYGSLPTYDELAYASFDQRKANRINIYMPDSYGPARELGFLKYITPAGALVDCSTLNHDLSLGRRKNVFYLSTDSTPIDIAGIYVSFHASKYLGDSINIEEIEISFEEDISTDVVTASISKVRDSFDSSVPFGITAANSMSMSLDNTDRNYNVFNESSNVADYIRKDVKFEVGMGWSLGPLNALSIQPDVWLNGLGNTWQDTARTIAASADGDPVGSWEDSSGSNNHAIQATSGKRFILKKGGNGLNGYSVLRSDGSNDTLISPITAGAAKTIFIVAKKLTAPDATNRAMFSMGSNASLVTRTAFAGSRYNWEFLNGGTGSSQIDGGPQDWHIYAIRISSVSSSEHWNDGGLPVAFNPDDGYSASTQLSLASIVDTGGYGDFDYAEIICYNSAISDGYINMIGNHLADKFLLTWFDLET